MTQRPDFLLGIPTPKEVTHLVDVVVDGLAVAVVEVKEVEQVEVMEAEEAGGESYLVTNVARKDILTAIAGLKEVVLTVRETTTWITTTRQRTSLDLMTKPYVVLLAEMILGKEHFRMGPI